ncbi:tumor suppressor ARF-like [Glossophaga mutica]
MVYTYLVTVRIRRACGPPRVRAFVVQIPRPAGEGAAPALRAAAALVLALVRSQRRARQPHPGRPEISTIFVKYTSSAAGTSVGNRPPPHTCVLAVCECGRRTRGAAGGQSAEGTLSPRSPTAERRAVCPKGG